MSDTQTSRPQRRGGQIGGRMGGGPMGPAEKPKNFKMALLKLFGYLKPYRARLLVVVIFALSSTLFSIVNPKILGDVTNKLVAGYSAGQMYDHVTESLPAGRKIPAGTTGAEIYSRLSSEQKAKIPTAQVATFKSVTFGASRPTVDFAYIGKIAMVLLGLYALSALFTFAGSWIMTGVTQRLVYRLRRELSEKINKLPLSYFDKNSIGDVTSRITNDVDTISQSLNQGLTQLITSVTLVVGILIMMLTISWELTLVAVLVIPLSMVFLAGIIKASQKYFVSQQSKLGEINGHIEEMFGGHQVMKLFNGQRASLAKFNKVNKQLHESAWKSQFISGLLQPIMSFINNLGYVGVAVVGGWLAINGRITIGGIQAFIQYMNQFTQPISQIANSANIFQSAAASAERVFEFLELPEESADTAREVDKVFKGAVEFKHVSFGYDKKSPIIKDFSVAIQPGQKIAIVGPTGAGKTTIVNLLMRFYDVDKGSILVDGVNINDIPRGELRQLFGMVLQDTWLFNGTLSDNIAYGKLGATKAEIKKAAVSAHADHSIQSLPGGYSSVLNEETDNISSGERQLMTIARTMLADAPMLILDEATSSVDTRTEVLIQQAMDKLMVGRTSFIIAHRLSTIRNADLILVMNNGSIVEQGTHTALLKRGGFYAGLYNSQFDV